jgi:DNA-binding NarL/FixJ family response regulator
MMDESKLRILLADDQILFAESLRTFLNNYAADMVVTGIALNGKEAVVLAQKDKPDIILMDIRMPEMDGVEAVRIIKLQQPEIKIIMLSTYHEDEMVRSALLAGASGYLLKDISPTELIAALRAINGGIMQISPQIVEMLVKEQYVLKNSSQIPISANQPTHRSLLGSPADREEPSQWPDSLTHREHEIFTLLATGYDNGQISARLNLAEQTVRNQVSTIYSKLNVKDRFEIIRLVNKRKN